MSTDDEVMAGRLVRLGGPRVPVSADRTSRVREVVHLRWRTGSRKRVVRRRTIAAATALAAAAALIVAVALINERASRPSPVTTTLANVERLEGQVLRFSEAGSQPAVLTLTASIRPGEWIQTGESGKVGLRFTGDTSIRADAGSKLRLLSAAAIELAEGALYVDTGTASAGLQVRTPLGSAHDVGTQFEVRVTNASLRIRVRSGIVELRRRNDYRSAAAGTELTASSAGVEKRDIEVFGPDWQWAAMLAQPFAIEGRTLTAFLEHLAREQGWVLRYEDAKLARQASSVTLHGSVEGLSAGDALAVVLNTTGFAHRLRDGELLITRSDSTR